MLRAERLEFLRLTTPHPARPRAPGLHQGARDLARFYLLQNKTMKPTNTNKQTAPKNLAEPMAPHMTGAELQTLRETCGLSRDEFATLADVAPRTVKHWENRAGGVPADVAKLAAELESAMRQAVIAHTERALFEHAPHGLDAPVILTRYREGDAMPRATWGTMLPSMQGACVARVRVALLGMGRAVRVVWFDADYTDPRETLKAQAIAHRGDQPPEA